MYLHEIDTALSHFQSSTILANHQPHVSISGKRGQSELHIRILDDAEPVLAVLTGALASFVFFLFNFIPSL